MNKEEVCFETFALIQKCCTDDNISDKEKIRRIYKAANHATTYMELGPKRMKEYGYSIEEYGYPIPQFTESHTTSQDQE